MIKLFNKNILLVGIVSIAMIPISCQKEASKKKEIHGIITANMDKKVRPNDDFFRYVNGSWLDKTEIPADRTSWGSFNELRKNTDADVLSILDEAIAQTKNANLKDAEGKLKLDSDQKKAVDLYETILDTVSRNKAGIEPLKPYLAKIDAIKNADDLQKLLTEMAPYGGIGYFGFYVTNDLKDSKMNAGYLSPAGLGLRRDYYVDQDKDTKEKREKYIAHIAKMFELYGDSKEVAETNAKKVFDYEYKLAVPRNTKEENRDARKRYNPKTIAELQKLTPEINWEAYFKGIGVTNLDKVIVTQPKYMVALNEILKSSSLEDEKLYLRWTLIDRTAGLLDTKLENTNWEFYGKELTGAKKQRPRDERALASVNGRIGEALGKLYVAKKFPPEAKAKAEEMIKNVMQAYKNRINALPWMTEDTKKKAIEKIEKMTVKIAYPDKWKDYSKLVINSTKNGGSFFQNSLNTTKWNFEENIEKLGKPVDRTRWGMSPQTVNAYFNPVNNEIVFPAAILQPPFYDYKADAAVNYGGIGAVIGHEISHCFDDSGSRFDSDGNLNNWWTKEDLEKFTALGDKLAAQYSAVKALKDVHLNGKYTLGENIGDLGGVNAAYDALELYFKDHKRPGKIDGFTPEQRFYLSWATVWRTKMRENALRSLIKTNPHSPGMYRAYMPLQNVDAFYTAFNIKEGDKMYLKPEDRVKIW
ncbi:MAG: M13 family metallopeptidase [Lutibacter sp.]|uniref:M13 family metallopeptidase n=1 Tax=Lutibacter sp. TaxID=1925666 RepID=UPI00299E3C4E|nr:M13 family metallopeptidase [Lutibacter sp.]MDX1828908.1 M13 family metallopeptidase [Lutibacter sp.]